METKLEQIAVKAVNQLPKSVVREIRTPRSVGIGGGRPPPMTRWAELRGSPLSRSQRLRAVFRVSDDGPSRWCGLQRGRRPKACKERTRGGCARKGQRAQLWGLYGGKGG